MPKQRAAPGSRPTIRDVAERAGVSIASVSQAFGGRRPIAAATRERVLAAAAELGYEADPAARSLRTGQSGLLGIILRPRDAARGAHEGAMTFPRLTGAVATDALDRGIALVHVPDLFDPAAARVPMDGCIVAFPYADDEVVTELMHRGTPVVLAEVDPERPEITWAVELDHEPPIRELLDGMAAAGGEAIALLAGTEDNAWNRAARRTYEQWSAENGRVTEVYLLYEGDGVAGAERFVGELLDRPQPPDAVIGGTGRFAVGAARASELRGLDVPDDLLVAALTDDGLTREHRPSITAIDLRLEDLGLAAMELLVARLDGADDPPAPRRIMPALSWRGSTRRGIG